jgi:predicted nucleic acid-binding protein
VVIVSTTASWSPISKGRHGAIDLIQPWIVAGEAATSQLVYGEAIEYIMSDANFMRRRTELRMLLRAITPYRLAYPILERYADLRRTLRPLGAMIGDIDTLIAATALVHDLTLVTLDNDYTRVPDLSVMLLTRNHVAH